MRKNYYGLLVVLLFLAILSSCQDDFLDQTVTTDLDEKAVFSDSSYTTAFLTDIYIGIGFSSYPGRFNSGGLQTATDEATPRILNTTTTDLQFITGTVNPIIIDNEAWDKPYENIRKVNQFLKHLPDTPLKDEWKVAYAAEARFLRAWYYAILLEHFGGVPLIGDNTYSPNDAIPSKRNTYEECVNYIVAECEAAAKDLTVKPRGRNFGRAGAGACMALKARVLLHAASALHNGSDFAAGHPAEELLGYPTADKERWKKAADAAKDLIDLGEYQLYVSDGLAEESGQLNGVPEPGFGFYGQFIPSDYTTYGAFDGIILMKMEDKGQDRERLFQPPSRGGSGNGGFPYQEMVDAFGMSNGKPIAHPDSGYDPENPYTNRDPRFYYSIIYDQAPLSQGGFGASFSPVNIYLGTYQGIPTTQDAVRAGTPTGYYINKMLNRFITANSFIAGPQSRPLMRYAEVLLNFAEAMNEYAGPTTEVYEAVELVRERAGLSPYQLEPGLSQEEMRVAIRQERRVELAFEGFRFWDVRRWMIAEDTQDQVMHGMEIRRNGADKTLKEFEVRKHEFRKAMYFWPIPQSEVGKSSDMIQNPYY